ncbi:MAG: cell division protein FtsZ [Dehalococcoidia bacterium]|nr:cell division protein FtsZ [Dehalococcoidia bacterium]
MESTEDKSKTGGGIESMARIKVIGTGGGGCNAVDRMCRDRIRGIDFIAVNTDAQSLARSQAPIKFQIGPKLTRGLGVGGNHALGTKAAEESRSELVQALKGADMVFITAGMGGGTGTGSAHIIAEIAKDEGALTVGIVTKPFAFEGSRRMAAAEEGLNNLKKKLDTLIVIPNDRLLGLCGKDVSLENAFRMADDVLFQGIEGISQLITVPGHINLDFADIKAIMTDAGTALMAIGRGTGENRAVDAAKAVISSPLLDVSIDGAKKVLFNVTGGKDLTLFEVGEAAKIIRQAADPDAQIIFGVVNDQKIEMEVRITLIATGVYSHEARTAPAMKGRKAIQDLIPLMFDDQGDTQVPPFLRKAYPVA